MIREVDLDTAKNELDISWQNDDTDSKIKRYLDEGRVLLKDYAGTDLKFIEGSFEGRLLLNYVYYANNKLTEFFEENYKRDLIKLRLKHQGSEITDV